MRLATLLSAALAVGLLCSAGARAGDKAPKKVLLVTHSGGFIHSSVTEAEKVLKEIGPKHGFEVTCFRYTNDPKNLEAYSKRFQQATEQPVTPDQIGKINADTLKPFDAVFFFTTGNPVETPEEMKALLDYVKGGKGFLGSHCATDTLYGMKEYGEMIGAYFDGHPMVGKTKVIVDDPQHPIVKHLGTSFEISDELYQFRDPYSRDKLHVLMRLDPLYVAQQKANEMKRVEQEKRELPTKIEKAEAAGKKDEAKKMQARLKSLENYKPNIRRPDNDHAMAWVREYGKGRVFYTALGHGENVWNDPRFRTMVIQAMRWVTHEIDGPADPSGARTTGGEKE